MLKSVILSIYYLVAKIGVGKVENEPSKVSINGLGQNGHYKLHAIGQNSEAACSHCSFI